LYPSLETRVSSTGGTARVVGGKARLVTEQRTRDGPSDDEGSLPAILATLVVLILIVGLFLLLKFNLFQGGTSVNVRTTAPAMSWIERLVD